MIVSQRCQYAISALIELAVHIPDEPIKSQEIASRQSIPAKFLEAILNELKHGGFVMSRRGSAGGYLLAKSPAEITVGEVVRLIQGPIEGLMTEISAEDDVFGVHAMQKLWKQTVQSIERLYGSTTFTDMVEWERAARSGAMNYSI